MGGCYGLHAMCHAQQFSRSLHIVVKLTCASAFPRVAFPVRQPGRHPHVAEMEFNPKLNVVNGGRPLGTPRLIAL